MTRAEMPALHTARLQPDEILALQRDITALGEVLSVTPKHHPTAMVPEHQVPLAEGISQLLSGDLRGLQLHYRFEERLWCDTLLVDGGDGVRLVRMEQLTA